MSLTKGDLESIGQLIDEKLSKGIEGIRALVQFELDRRITPLEDKISHLPTKDEFYKMMDEWIVEVKEYRQERVFLSSKISTHEKRLNEIESVLKVKSPNG